LASYTYSLESFQRSGKDMFLYVCDWSHSIVVLNLVWNIILDKWLFCSHVIFSQMNHGSNLLSLIFLLSVCWNNMTICILLLKGKIISDFGFKIKNRFSCRLASIPKQQELCSLSKRLIMSALCCWKLGLVAD